MHHSEQKCAHFCSEWCIVGYETGAIMGCVQQVYFDGSAQVCGNWNGVNTLRPRQNGRHFADDTFKPIFLKENIRNTIKISLKFVPRVPINNIPALVQIMAWRRSGNKSLSEPMMVSLLTHICVTRPQWVNTVLCWATNFTFSIWTCKPGYQWHTYKLRTLHT